VDTADYQLAMLVLAIGTIFAAILTTYLVKMARRLIKLMDSLRFAIEHQTERK
jgi:hypothetical protein